MLSRRSSSKFPLAYLCHLSNWWKTEQVSGIDQGQQTNAKIAGIETLRRSIRQIHISRKSHPVLPLMSSTWNKSTPDWRDLPTWVTRRTINVDGNFHADHITMRKPDWRSSWQMVKAIWWRRRSTRIILKEAKEPRFVSLLIKFF